jgi:hypothetical protein
MRKGKQVCTLRGQGAHFWSFKPLRGRARVSIFGEDLQRMDSVERKAWRRSKGFSEDIGSCGSGNSDGRASPGRSGQHDGKIVTVNGSIAPSDLRFTLPYEHVLVDFIGADKVSPDRYASEEAFAYILPHLAEASSLGCEALLECTPSYNR